MGLDHRLYEESVASFDTIPSGLRNMPGKPRDTQYDRCKQCRTYQKNHTGRDHEFVPKFAAAGLLMKGQER